MTWDYHTKDYEKQTKNDPVWRLERMIQYGLGKKKLKRDEIKKYLPQLRIPAQQKFFLQLLLDETAPAHHRTKKRH